MSTPTGRDVKPFVGSFDFAGSRDFYVAIGWRVNWQDDDLAEMELNGSRFYLQRYYNKEWCNNTMMHITVDDAQAWYDHVHSVISTQTFSAAPGEPRVAEPKQDPHGSLVTYVWDPAGNLLHFAQPSPP